MFKIMWFVGDSDQTALVEEQSDILYDNGTIKRPNRVISL